MFPYYSTFNTYPRLSYRYSTLGDTTRVPIEGIGTAVYTLNGHTILTHNTLHIPDLQVPLYSLRKHRQRPGCRVYSSYKYGSYLFLPDFILQVEDSYDNIFRYRSLGASYQGLIDYIEPKSTSSTAMSTPLGRPYAINPEPTPQEPHIILSDEESISSQASLFPSIYNDCLPQFLTKITPTDPSDATLHKNSVEPLSICTLNIVHRDDRNLPPIHPS